MKKTRLLLSVAILVSLSKFSYAQQAAAAAPADPWNFDYDVFARFVVTGGTTVDKDDQDKIAGAPFFRFRPGFTATKGNFTSRFQLGSDVYFGQYVTGTPGGGGTPMGNGYNPKGAIQLRNAYVGYTWDSGLYTKAGIQGLTIPYYDDDNLGGITLGWKNDKFDVDLFFFGLTLGGNVLAGNGDSGTFGLKSDLQVSDGFHIKPYIVSLYQGDKTYQSYGADAFDFSPSSWGYSDNAMYQGGIGVLPGVNISYDAGSGFTTDMNVIYAYGHNEFYTQGKHNKLNEVDQTRNAFAVNLNLGYKKDSVFSTNLFFDYRSGDDDANASGTNHSFNGSVLEYDAGSPDLIIIYNSGATRLMPAYGNTAPDGFAYSDHGVMSVGTNDEFTISSFSLGFNLGYAWYAAGSGDKTLGFELDIVPSYQITDGFKAYLNFAMLVAGDGLKNNNAGNSDGSSNIIDNARIPVVIGFGLEADM